MSFNFGGGSSRGRESGVTQVIVPEPSPEEKELRRLNLDLARRQIAQLEKIEAEEAARAGSPLGQMQTELETVATRKLLDRLTGRAPVLSPEEQARLDTIFGTAQRRGEESLTKYAREIASTRGLRVSDSPIGNEALRQQRELTEGLGAARAGAELDLGQAETGANEAVAQFQAALRTQAFQNRLALAGFQPPGFGLQQQMFSERFAGAPRSFSGRSRNTWSQWQAGLSGQDVGSGLQGVGAAYTAFAT
jgi:hypothetical protein